MNAEIKIKKILSMLYKVISGPKGFNRDWEQQQALFTPHAKLIRTSIDKEGKPQTTIMNILDYPNNFDQLIAGRAFYEIEMHNIIEIFGNIAHAFSTYEAWGDKNKTQFIKRGINSIQFLNDGTSWKIVHMIWDDERPGLTMSSKYNPTVMA
ncbi:hypothetical protein MO867_06870 [Microbulbifer sp. OS29]|uniref:SnoaL-like domain-containing protein n=1 Tax=Microbulbifer okhotskensis TaxID=2926617 RepID=A0A9X2J414_9GAMM|nr:hypothetical protein [Microbulbifer okhotskensis]MCO1334062.1 hypothetical protein [Microbulbifer okhotskensis]